MTAKKAAKRARSPESSSDSEPEVGDKARAKPPQKQAKHAAEVSSYIAKSSLSQC